jgi:hypothetical protein
MAKEIPTFAVTAKHEATIGGQRLAFYPISGLMQLRALSTLGAPVSRLIDVLFAGAEDEERQAAIGDLLKALGASGPTVGALILDSLRDEEWAERAPGPKAVDLFLQKLDGPSLAAMLAAVVAVNTRAHGEELLPLAAGLVAGLRQTVQGAAASLSTSDGGSAS